MKANFFSIRFAMMVAIGMLGFTIAGPVLAQKDGVKKNIRTNGNTARASDGKGSEIISARNEAASLQNAAPSIDGAEEGACPICPVNEPSEVHVLLSLRERRIALNAREHQLSSREAALEKLSRDLDRRVGELDQQVAKLEDKLGLGEPARARHEARLVALVDSLGGMTPKKAAPMLAEADPQVAAEVMRRLGPDKSRALLLAMPAAKAGRLMSMGLQVAPKGEKSSRPTNDTSSQTSAPGGN